MKVSVVIPVFNEEKYIGACIASLFAQTIVPDEIIVVDNNSTDKTVQVVKKFPVTIIIEKKQGTIFARNTGFDLAKGDIIGRIDADTMLPKNWVEIVKRRFKKDRTLIAYSGPTLFQDRRFNKLISFPEKLFIASFKKIIGCDLLYGPNMVLRKKAWDKVKSFLCTDDKIVHEDLDIPIHLHALGLGKIWFDKRFTVEASERRWKKMVPYFEYPYRYLRTLQHHTHSLRHIKTGAKMVRYAFYQEEKQ